MFSGHELHNAMSRNNIFYSRGRTYPRDSGAPPKDFQNDLTGAYLGGGFVRSMFRPSQGLEWFLSPTMNRIQWGRISYTRNGKDFAITDPLVQAANPALDRGPPAGIQRRVPRSRPGHRGLRERAAPAPFWRGNGARLFTPALGTVLAAATEHGARSEGVDVPYCTPSCVFSRARPQ